MTIALKCTVFELGAWDRRTDGRTAVSLNARTLVAVDERNMIVVNVVCQYRPADRTGEDLDMIYAHLKDLKAFEKFHPLLLQQICYYSFYEDLEQGVIRKYRMRGNPLRC